MADKAWESKEVEQAREGGRVKFSSQTGQRGMVDRAGIAL
jgi:hypothetical protein